VSASRRCLDKHVVKPNDSGLAVIRCSDSLRERKTAVLRPANRPVLSVFEWRRFTVRFALGFPLIALDRRLLRLLFERYGEKAK